jgi:uncharacterized membrane protein YfcA
MMLFTGIILFVAAVVQGVVGFAMAIVAIPLLVWTGLPLSEAIAISATSTFVQALTGMVKLRHAIPWSIVKPAVIVRLLALPIGILMLIHLDGIETSKIKAFLGAFIILLVLFQVCLKIEPREALPTKWNYLAFACSGLFAGMVGIGGPPLVLWLSAHRWSGEKIKAFLFANFAVIAPVSILLIWISLGDSILAAAGTGLMFAPIVIVGTLVGVRLGTHIPRELFRKILFCILIVLGLFSITIALIG